MNKKKIIGKTAIFAALGVTAFALVKKYGSKNYKKGYSNGYDNAESDLKEELDFRFYRMEDKIASCRQKIDRLRELSDAYRCESINLTKRCNALLDTIAENTDGDDYDDDDYDEEPDDDKISMNELWEIIDTLSFTRDEYIKALELIEKEQRASVAFLIKNMNINNKKATELINILEMQGFIGKSNGKRPRIVYIDENLVELIKTWEM